MSSSFQPHTHRAAAPAPPPGPPSPVHTTELAALRHRVQRLSRGFAVANAAFFAVVVLLACTSGGLLGTKVFGQVNLGILVALVQGVLLMWTAWRFDRRSADETDPVADELGARFGEQHERTAERRDEQYGERHDPWANSRYPGHGQDGYRGNDWTVTR